MFNPPGAFDVRVVRGRMQRQTGKGEVVLTTTLIAIWRVEQPHVLVEVAVTKAFEPGGGYELEKGMEKAIGESQMQRRRSRH